MSPQSPAPRKILLTAALPYANGYIHLGHMVEYLQADFWCRFQKMRGHDTAYICADDTHGTAIMIRGRELGISPKQVVAQVWKEHTQDFKDFGVEFSHYSSTDSEENRELCEEFYSHLKAKGHIHKKSVEQLYCETDKMFLADRFVKGTCPNCGSKDQYGDACDVCHATYNPDQLKDRYCSVCRTAPIKKTSEHILFRVNDYKAYLQQWLPAHLNPEFTKKMLEWFNEDLRDWDISRDEPYFGFQIPGEPGKYFYVWVDAPMGYVSSTLQWCKKEGRDFNDYWKSSDKAEVYHFIGKDIVYFHSLFWPAFLKAADFRSPNAIYIHGRLMIDGEKMSKSKGTMIPARTYLNHLDQNYLRYYYATKLNSSSDDFDLSMDDFTQRVNSDLIGKITNLASRGAQMLTKKMDSVMSEPDAEGLKLIKSIQAGASEMADWMEGREFAKATTRIREWADEANRYFDEKAPWKTLEGDPTGTKKVLTSTLNIFRMLAIYLKPFIPAYTAKVEKLFNESAYGWKDLQKTLTQHRLSNYEHLATRILPEQVKSMMDESKKISDQLSKERGQASAAPTVGEGAKPTAAAAGATESSLIEIDDFMKVDLRVARIIEAEEIKEADKLLKLKVDLGGGETRQIIAGIKAAYKPADLIGRLTVVVANLKPRKMKFGESQGMVLAAGLGGSDLFILSPDSGAQPGQRIK
jgi:methionyl-tRNA synthetase